MQHISVKELKKRIEQGEKLNVIDVREPWEYEEFNIGAQNFPLSTFMNHLDELEQFKNQELIVHCKAGVRSHQAAMLLEQAGFTNVKNLTGGMNEWQQHS